MKSDCQFKTDVACELEGDPTVDATAIGVPPSGGVVTPSGQLQVVDTQAA
jgi:osmotically-inducible protein OsmY